MITIMIAQNIQKVKEIVVQMLSKIGNTNIGIRKEGDIITIAEKDGLKDLVSLKDKIIQLEDSLYNEKKGAIYKYILEEIERPLIEHTLERTEGNQIKAAKILGMNRNTIRAKIKKLGINNERYKDY